MFSPLAIRSLLLAPLTVVPLSAGSAEDAGAGVVLIQADDPVNGGSMNAALLYPATRQTQRTTFGPYLVDAERDAPAASGRRGLILLSHGTGGTMWGHHDLASALARDGFLVAAVEHPGDNYRDQSKFGTDRVLLGRARQISALLDRILADPRWQSVVDSARIGVAGFSAGGYTSLLLAGARPNFDLFKSYCRRHSDDHLNCRGDFQVRKTAGDLGATADPRIRAVFAMAPLAIPFDAAGLAPVKVPVFLYVAERDRVLMPGENGERIRTHLPKLAGYRSIPGADHYVFLAPCSETLRKAVPEICGDPPGVDRTAVHQQISRDAVSFFRETLGH